MQVVYNIKVSVFSRLLFSTFFILLFLFFLQINVYAATVSLDSTFGTNGKTITTFGNSATSPRLGIQLDGKKILVGRASNGNNNDWVVYRYEKDGNPDATFGNNGIITRDFGGNDILISVFVQPDGKILVGGSSTNNEYWTIGRFKTDGSLDTAFGSGGIVSIVTRGFVSSLIVQPDGKIIAVGYQTLGGDKVALVRYNSNGSLDTTFGAGGTVITAIGSINDRGNDAILQPDGKILVLGDFNAGGHDELFLARYNSNGVLDMGFGAGGKVIMQIGATVGARDMTLQVDGKIIVTGGAVNIGQVDTYVARHNSDGTLDNAFGTGGKVLISFIPGNDSANSIALQSDGKIVLGGYEDSGASSGIDFALRRFNTDGTLDSTFDGDGSLVLPISTGHDEITSVAIQSDGKIIGAGNVFNGNYFDWAITRFVVSDYIDLPVPLLKQNDPAWGNQVYDSANIWSPNSPGISSWGCALTSAAMVFRFHGIQNLPNGTPLDPGTLNSWLKSQSDGYIRNGLVNWLSLSRLSRVAKPQNPSFLYDALEYQRVGSMDTILLKSDIENNRPGILEEPGHFIVAKGTTGAGFDINDPFYSRNSLSDYSNTFLSMGRYIPSNTDLSYIMLVVDSNINIVLKDTSGNILGEEFIQSPINNTLSSGSSSGNPLKTIYFKAPSTGVYKVFLTSLNNSPYRLDAYLYDSNGNVVKRDFSGRLNKTKGDSFTINFDKNNSKKNKIQKKEKDENEDEDGEEHSQDNKDIFEDLVNEVRNFVSPKK